MAGMLVMEVSFFGKDPPKLTDHPMQHVTLKHIAAGLADKCEVQLAYAIGLQTSFRVS